MLTLSDARSVHLVGAAGSGMSALAALLLKMGKQVSGSDLVESPSGLALRAAGARLFLGHDPQHLAGAQLVVRSAAVDDANREIAHARALGLPTMKLAEAVGSLMAGRQGVGVAGTHGKSTTTALVAWLLERGGLEPTALIGAEALNFQSGAILGSGPMVVEADEYDRRFLHLSPEVAVVTSVEADHLDYFRDLAEIELVFQEFVDKVPVHGRLVVCADDPGAARLRTVGQRDSYGFSTDATWRATEYASRAEGGSAFSVTTAGRSWPAESPLVGIHNARNALAALAVADYFGMGLRPALAALREFAGTRRRFETKGRPNGVWVVDDYAHHPTAVAATLRALRHAGTDKNQVWAIFQPHTSNRTHALLAEFARSFGDADHALVLPIYRPSGREAAARAVSSTDLVERLRANGHPDARLVETFDEALAIVRAGVVAGDAVITLGAGNVTDLSDQVVRCLGGEGLQ